VYGPTSTSLKFCCSKHKLSDWTTDKIPCCGKGKTTKWAYFGKPGGNAIACGDCSANEKKLKELGESKPLPLVWLSEETIKTIKDHKDLEQETMSCLFLEGKRRVKCQKPSGNAKNVEQDADSEDADDADTKEAKRAKVSTTSTVEVNVRKLPRKANSTPTKLVGSDTDPSMPEILEVARILAAMAKKVTTVTTVITVSTKFQ